MFDRLFSIPPSCAKHTSTPWTAEVIRCLGFGANVIEIAVTDRDGARHSWTFNETLLNSLEIPKADIITNLANCQAPSGASSNQKVEGAGLKNYTLLYKFVRCTSIHKHPFVHDTIITPVPHAIYIYLLRLLYTPDYLTSDSWLF